MRNLKIFAGKNSKTLAEKICNELNVPLSPSLNAAFADGETRVELHDNCRGRNIFIIQSTSKPTNDSLVELLLMIDAAKRASAKTITAVVPYFGYSRQDRKVKPRVPISAKVAAKCIENIGATRIITVDIHSTQTQGFFDIPVDNLFSTPVFEHFLKENNYLNGKNIVIVAPDSGALPRSRALSKRIPGSNVAVIDKRREEANQSKVMYVLGDVKDRTAFLFDDMIDTGGTLVNAAEAILNHGAKEVYAICTHAVMSYPCLERLESSRIKEVIVTDTIEHKNLPRNIKTAQIAPMLAQAIQEVEINGSVSRLFK